MREIVLDTETTGIKPEEGHRIVEIGCVEVFNKIPTGKVFHSYLNPEREMPHEAFKIHGIAGEFLLDKPLFSLVADEFIEFLEDSKLVIHNAQFDMKFINHELVRIGKSPIDGMRAIDTLPLARRKFPGGQNSLDGLCKRFNIDLSEREKHGALLDAKLLAAVYLQLHGGTQSKFDLNSSVENNNIQKAPHNFQSRPALEPTANELAAHQEFISKIKEPIW